MGAYFGVGELWRRGSSASAATNPWQTTMAGVSINQGFTNWFSLQAELNWEGEMKKIDIPLTDDMGQPIGTAIVKGYSEKVSLPLMAHFSTGNKVKVFVNSGPFLKYWVAAFTVSQLPGQKKEVFKEDYWEKTNRLHAGAALGIGLAFALDPNTYLSLEIRDHLGLTKYNKETSALWNTRDNAVYILPAFVYKIR
jgi:hypothetical protein